jgi:hypothetical protein
MHLMVSSKIDEPDTISHCKFRTRDPWLDPKKQTNKDKKDHNIDGNVG